MLELFSDGVGRTDQKWDSMAYAELFLVFGVLFRRFNFELFETDQSDVDLKHDFFLPSPKLDSKGVRVNVTEVYE